MQQHPNEERLSRLYEAFSKGDFGAVLDMCADGITFHVPSGTAFSGVHTKATFQDWIGQVWSISGGSFREIPYLLVANDHQGVALLDHYLTRNDQPVHYRVNHIWNIRNGLFTRWEEWPGDEEAFYAAWA
jgi:ketosteroid isomerase-like protein